jgi:heme exporter protein A
MFLVESLACRRGRQLVFRDVSFSLKDGDLLLLTGRNGSGKSSLLRVLAGFLTAAEGAISWRGEPLTDQKPLHYIGHLDAVKSELTVGEMCDYWRVLRCISPRPSDSALEFFGLAALINKKILSLSAGQKRRLALTRLLLDDAPLWLLDEPTTSLDHKGQEALAALITAHRAKGGMAILATHRRDEFPDAKNLALDGEGL